MAPAGGSDSEQDILYGLHAVREALRAGTRPLQRLLVVRTDKQFGDLVQLARSLHVPIHVQPLASLDRIVPGGRHQGIVAYAAAKAYETEESILALAAERKEPPLLVVLDGVEDPHNLGAVLRTAEGAGVHGVFIPERRAAGLTSVVAKVSAGAIDHIPVARVTNTTRLLETLKEAGVWIYGLEPTATKLYTEVDLTGPVGLVFGGEGKGIRPGVLQHCDERIRIPMKGHVQSLNVSASAAVMLFETVRQRGATRLANLGPTGS
jgi:23S rRNA (guanosine2251-2'-O)-methyltransferase